MVIDGGDDFYGMSIEDKKCVGVVGGWLPNHLTPLDGPWTPIGPIAPTHWTVCIYLGTYK